MSNNFLKPADGQNSNSVVFEVKEGQGTYDIAEKLESQGLIKSKTSFVLYVKIRKYSLSPGAYQFSASMPISEIAKKIANGEIAYTKVLFQEGLRREQMAQILNKNGFTDYQGFLQKTEGMEGKLFPDTYYFPMTANMDRIISDISENYQKRTAGLDVTQKDLIVASIIEREAKNDSDREIISGIIQNRLVAGMKLEMDPTVIYAYDNAQISKEGVMQYKFWLPIAASLYKTINSKYNTYYFAGLPPAPICNPGLKSIRAALNPEDNQYFYFLHGNDGQLYVARTLSEHQANIQSHLRN